jgi:hypothetical protein
MRWGRGNTVVGQSGQAESSARPLRRRADKIDRPARVRIRRRKPWVRLRRRLLGWKVRLLTGELPHVLVVDNLENRHSAERSAGMTADAVDSDFPTVRGAAVTVKLAVRH